MRRLLTFLFLTLLAAAAAPAQVSVLQADDRISVEIGGEHFTDLVLKGEDVRKPYFYPIRSASGKVVTRHYPMKVIEGESHDHPHHRGLWFSHGDVNGFDFWTADPSRAGDHYGSIELDEVVEVTGGEREGSLKAVFDWKDGSGMTLLKETRTVRFSGADGLRVMDFHLELTGVEDAHFGDTKEGTFAIRVADSMNEQHSGTLVNAAGARGEERVWGKASPWMDYYGEVDGETLGVAFLDHPSNPKHPTFWHVRGYGLFAANVFGEHDFSADDSRDGGLTLKKGERWEFRYRVLIHSGSPEEAGIAARYREFSGE